MRKKISTKIAVIAMSMTTVLGTGLGTVNTFAANPLKVSNVKQTSIKAKKRKSKTTTHSLTVKKNKSIYVGPGHAGMFPQTSNWKSSNSSVATVSKKGDREGGHKVIAKKKGKTTISCVVSKSSGNWVKGDIYKWVVTVK